MEVRADGVKIGDRVRLPDVLEGDEWDVENVRHETDGRHTAVMLCVSQHGLLLRMLSFWADDLIERLDDRKTASSA